MATMKRTISRKGAKPQRKPLSEFLALFAFCLLLSEFLMPNNLTPSVTVGLLPTAFSQNETATPSTETSNAGAKSETIAKPPSDRNTRSAIRATGKKENGLAYGKPVPGKVGLVTSPYSPDSGYIDVRGFAPGTPVKDPYTGKIFLTP